MARAEKAWREALRTQTLADLITHYQQNVELEQRQRGEQWIEERMHGGLEKS